MRYTHNRKAFLPSNTSDAFSFEKILEQRLVQQ